MQKFTPSELINYLKANKPNRVYFDYESDLIEDDRPDYQGIAFLWLHAPVQWSNGIELSLMYAGSCNDAKGAELYPHPEHDHTTCGCYTDGFVTLDGVQLVDNTGGVIPLSQLADLFHNDWHGELYNGDFWQELKDIYEANHDYHVIALKDFMQGMHDGNK